MLDQRRKLECRSVVPVGDGISPEINIVVGRRGTIDDHCTHDSVRVLVRVVAVIPSRPKLGAQKCVGA